MNSWDGKTLMKNVAKSVIGKARDFFMTETQENGNIPKWEDFKIKLRKEFGKNIKFLKRDLQNAKQEEKAMKGFFERIKELSRQIQRDMDEEEIRSYIVDGLKKEYRGRINLLNNNTLQQLKDNIEKEEYNRKIEKEKNRRR